MSENNKQEIFLAKVAKGSRITIYEPVREFLGIEEHDLVRVTVQLAKKAKSTELPPSDLNVSDIEEPIKTKPEEDIVEPQLFTLEPEPEEDLEEETPELPEEEPTEKKIIEPLIPVEPEDLEEEEPEYLSPCPSDLHSPLQDLKLCRRWGCTYYKRKDKEGPEECTWPGWKTREDEEPITEVIEVVEPEPEPEEVSEKGESWGQEHVDPCPEGLDWPLQDLKICRKCKEHYKRKYGENPEACLWTQWRKVGWEDENQEKLGKDIAEEPAEEQITEPEKPMEEVTETKDTVLVRCESGAHKPGLIPHEKRDLGDGWAMYTCLSCKKTTPMLISNAEEILEAEG